MKARPADQLGVLLHGTVETITAEDLAHKLGLGRPLRVKLGIDASGPDIHLGFAVVLRKLRQYQDFGHIAVLVVGDFTGMIGDPSGRSRTRPQLDRAEIERNMARYQEQIARILNPRQTEFVYNSTWNAPLTAADLVDLTARYTVAQLLEREDFRTRLAKQEPLFVHEILYPIFQGYDSVATRADVELGGQDQTLNLLVGRELQRAFGQEPQVIMTLPLLEGTDGVRKMSKSYNNYIGIDEAPREIYGKLMSIPDASILNYFRLATDRSDRDLVALAARLKAGENPKTLKMELARAVVTLYHSAEAAGEAESEFERVFASDGLPDDMPELAWPEKTARVFEVIVRAKLLPSRSEVRRKLAEGAVYVDGERVTDPETEMLVDKPRVVKVGKRRFVRVIPQS